MMLRQALCAWIILFSIFPLPAAANDDWRLSVGGNMQYDWLRTDEDDTLTQLGDVRRTRLSLGIRAPGGLTARAEYDAFDNAWTDVYLRWRGGPHSVRIGQYKQPMFLDELSSDRFTMFMEQGLPASFALARRLGAEYTWTNPQWRASFSVHDGNLLGLLDGMGGVGRVVYTPFSAEGHLLHLGLSLGSESPEDERARFASRVEGSRIGRTRLDTGILDGVDRINRSGLEALWINDAWTLQGEYMRASLSRADSSDANLHGWYVAASWFVSGDRTGYRNGAIQAPNLGEDGRAFELALRASSLDLDDASVRGGDSTNFTLGANWYPNAHVRLTANYVHVDGERRGVAVEPDILQARVMLTF